MVFWDNKIRKEPLRIAEQLGTVSPEVKRGEGALIYRRYTALWSNSVTASALQVTIW